MVPLLLLDWINSIWRNLPIGRKLLVVIGGIVGIVMITTMITTLLFFSVTNSYDRVMNEQLDTWFSQQEIEQLILERFNALLEYVITGEELQLERFYTYSARATQMERFLLDHSPQETKDEVADFVIKSQDWDFLLRNKVIPVYQLGNKEDAIETLTTIAEPLAQALVQSVSEFSERKEFEIRSAGKDAVIRAQQAMVICIVLAFLAIVAALLLAWILTRSITKPITDLKNATKIISEGELNFKVPIYGKDELGQLGQAFQTMGEKLINLIEELNRTNEQLRQESRKAQESNRIKSEFLATMSHEFRTPLNGIIGFSEVLLQKIFGPLTLKQEQYLSHIEQNGKHLLELINDMLDLSKIEAGKMEIQLKKVELMRFFSNSLFVIKEKAKKQQVEVQLDYRATVQELEIDPIRVTQIMNNLLSNAIKFTPNGGNVTVRVENDHEHVYVSVIDTGIGIREDRMEKIFEPFYQDEGNYDRRFEGTGLGLALTKKLVALCGGTITVTSKPGKGSTFTFTLPLNPSEAIKRSEDKVYLSPFIGNTLKDSLPMIWMVTDDRSLFDSLEKRLSGKYRLLFVNEYEIVEKVDRATELPQLILYEYNGRKENHRLKLEEWLKEIDGQNISVVIASNIPLTLKEKGALFRYAHDVWELPNQGDTANSEHVELLQRYIAEWFQKQRGEKD